MKADVGYKNYTTRVDHHTRRLRARVFVSLKRKEGPSNVLEMMAERYNHTPADYRKILLPSFLKDVGFSEETIADEVKNFTWSQYAGCTCPCSPGFIYKGSSGKLPRKTDFFIRCEEI